jgi:thiol-disulfide isomerase/thioredoxin
MNRFTMMAILLCSMALNGIAREGYHITLKMPAAPDSVVYLVHYYGKPLPTIYKRDSARLDKKGVAVFDSKDPEFTGGIYMMLLSDRKTYFEFLLDKGDDMTITADISKLPQGLTFKNSAENEHFQEYVGFLKGYSARQQDLHKEYANARTAEDTAAIRKKSAITSKELTAYRKAQAQKYPGTLLATIFHSLEIPQVPEGEHMLPDGKTKDSSFAYNYYKNHYWDAFDLSDDRLIHTPVFDAKLEEYMNKLVMPWPDSVIKESNMLLTKTKDSKELFKYTLWWLTHNAENSKIMGMDEVFVYLVENYYMKGEASWLTSDELTKYVDRAMKIAPNVIGNLAPEIKLPNLMTQKEESLQAVKAKYTLVLFYAPTCGHCKEEIPHIDSLYKASLKAKGLKVYCVSTEGDEAAAKDFVTKHKLGDWITTWDPEHVGDWRSKYDVYSTPSIYLLDEKKIIRGKRLDHSNIASLVEMMERKEKYNKK